MLDTRLRNLRCFLNARCKRFFVKQTLPPGRDSSHCDGRVTLQLATLAARDAEDADASEASVAEAAVSQTAYDMLLQLATDPRHGLAEAAPAAASVDTGSPQSGEPSMESMKSKADVDQTFLNVSHVHQKN